MIPHLTPHEFADAVQTVLSVGFVLLTAIQFWMFVKERRWLEEALLAADEQLRRTREIRQRLIDERDLELDMLDRRAAALISEFHPDNHPLVDAHDVAARLSLLRGTIRAARGRQ